MNVDAGEGKRPLGLRCPYFHFKAQTSNRAGDDLDVLRAEGFNQLDGSVLRRDNKGHSV